MHRNQHSTRLAEEPSHLVAQKDPVLVARTLCQQSQAQKTIPVRVYNPTDESVQLFAKTTLGILTPTQELTGVQLETASVIPKQVNKVSRDCQTSQELPDELQTLEEEATVVINPQQAKDFQQLLLIGEMSSQQTTSPEDSHTSSNMTF